MDPYYDYGIPSNGDKNVQNAGKVYINPYFQRNSAPNFQKNDTILQNNSMYLNPQFHTNTQNLNLKPSNINRPKIYVNPNFVRANTSVPADNHYSRPIVASTMKSYYEVPNASIESARMSTPVVGSYYSSARSGTRHTSYESKRRATVTSSTYSLHLANVTPPINRCALHYSYLNNRNTITSTDSLQLPNVAPIINRSALHNSYLNNRNTTVTSTDSLQLPIVVPTINPLSTQAVAVAKSRYSLINKNTIGKVENKIVTNTDKIVTKMKISKYKTISLDQVKKMQNQKDKPMLPKVLPKTNIQVVAETTRIINRDFTKSRFKFIKNNLSTKAMKMEYKKPIKRSLSSSKIMLGSSQKVKARVGMTKFKKNNIPCPLFKKYGTCLRNSKGNCEYLHDKKHVSICRKFLKGVCHFSNCLLSHEITVEKMPTCSFYLKGMCTREDCPYLHVKLNEKTKICLDFLKGYCEKGNKCLNRHVNICPDQAMKGSCIRKKCPYPHNRPNKKNIFINKVHTRKLNQSLKSIINKKIDKRENINENNLNQCMNKVEENKDKDCRYYKEVVEDKTQEEVEMIKPTRCKLGALPSFIQL